MSTSEHATEKGIIVANVPDFCLSEVADHTMTLILAIARKLMLMDRHTRQGHWRAQSEVKKCGGLQGRHWAWSDLEAIAQHVARRASAFDMKIIAYDPLIDHSRAQSLDVRAVGLKELLSEQISSLCMLRLTGIHAT